MRFSLITPSRGDRPRALKQAIDSVAAAIAQAEGLAAREVEMLVGFDGVKGERVSDAPFVRWFDFPPDNDFGNAIRSGLLKAARGERLVFLDDDNALTPQAFSVYLAHPGVEMLVARVDTSRAFPDVPFLPRADHGEVVRQGNIDTLCACLARDLVLHRGRGWEAHGYQSDFINFRRYQRRAASFLVVDEVVGVYDAGVGLDSGETADSALQAHRRSRMEDGREPLLNQDEELK